MGLRLLELINVVNIKDKRLFYGMARPIAS